MGVRIAVETVIEAGTTHKHGLSGWSQPFRQMSGEAIGLTLEDDKAILAQIKKTIVQDQVEEMSGARRSCPKCGQVTRIHDYRSRKLETMLGRLWARARCILLCTCLADARGDFR